MTRTITQASIETWETDSDEPDAVWKLKECTLQKRDLNAIWAYNQRWDMRYLGTEWQLLAIIFGLATAGVLSICGLILAMLYLLG